MCEQDEDEEPEELIIANPGAIDSLIQATVKEVRKRCSPASFLHVIFQPPHWKGWSEPRVKAAAVC